MMLDDKNNFLRILWKCLLIPFVIGLITVSQIPDASKVMVLYGLVFTWIFSIFYFFHYKLKLPSEVYIYLYWFIWSLTGLFTAINQTLYWESLTTVVEIWVLIYLMAGNMILQRSISSTMLAIAIGGIILGLTSYFSGELQILSEIESKSRAGGIVGNANDFAYSILFIIFSMFYFWEIKSSFRWRILLIGIVTASVIPIICSASRKGFLSVLVFLSLWFFYCQANKLFKKPLITILILLILIGAIYYTTDYVMSNTYLGQRLIYAREHHGSETRTELYKESFDTIKKYPLFGVGLGNFRLWTSSGMYAHSDYMEVATNTGIIGFILYFAIYIVLWCRLNRIKKLTDDSQVLYIINLLKAAILTILFTGFGTPHMVKKITWIFLGTAIGYSWWIKQMILKNRN